MTHISEQPFFDEYDNIFEIKKLVHKERYKKPFKLLHQLFFNDHLPRITVGEMQHKMGLHDRSIVWQILESLRIMNLLEKQTRKNCGFYSPINKEFWDIGIKELKSKHKK